MTSSTLASLADLSNLTSSQKTALINTIAKEMAMTMLTISKELQHGNLQAENTQPIYSFIRTIQNHEVAARHKLERKLERYERQARESRAERRWILREFEKMKRRIEVFRRRWTERMRARLQQLVQDEIMESQMLEQDSESGSNSRSGENSGSGDGVANHGDGSSQ
ncbi:hypothetical protein BJY04DRAFT_107281 [Aspergillus karnatakaensis]|uniref:uncharacterized protein n=1 Tax=Aspergillus karnatakaensis TaxID=1810916 RepID=UPI003CCCFB99